MSMNSHADSGIAATIASLVRWSTGLMERIPYSIVALAARVFPAAVFWYSGRTKVEGWQIWKVKDSAILLFENDFQLPLINPEIAAHLAAWAEHFFPILLVIGLATRYAALALLFMTAVIQIFVFPGAWPTHGVWAACFLIVIARGPGVLSLDHLIAGRFGV